MNEPKLQYKDPDTANAVNILECMWIDTWSSINITPKVEIWNKKLGKPVRISLFALFEDAMGHLMENGSIAMEEVQFDA